MQTAHNTLSPHSETLRLGPAAQRMIVPGLILSALGGGLAFVCGFRDENAPTLFHHAYLLAFLFYLTITLGSLFFVILHHLAKAGWSVTLRRLAEGLSANIFILAILFLPIALGLANIYPWAKPAAEHQASGEAKADDGKTSEGKTGEGKTSEAPESKDKPAATGEAAGGETEPSIAGHDRWLTPANFKYRFAIYFVVWGILTWYYRGHSILQDKTGSVNLSRSMEGFAPLAMILWTFTLTGAAIDLIMSLNPHWYSTMIGVYLFADSVLSSLVVITLLALALQSAGLLRGVITVEHYHDLGKLTFAFVFFWGYIAFSQYMLIWYSNMPEETQFYSMRQIGPWVGVSLALIVVHFALPFLGLMSRHIKRATPLLAFWLIWLLVAHALDLFWLIMPNSYIGQISLDGKPLPEAFKTVLESQQSVYQLSNSVDPAIVAAVHAPLQPAAIATVIGLLVFMGGLFVANTAWSLGASALMPVKDPRLEESLNFHNT